MTFHDISARRQAEAKLQESEERFRTLAETASDVIVTIDEGSRILFINPAAEKVFGYRPEELTGQSLSVLMPEYLPRLHEAGLARYVETGRRHINWGGVELPGLHREGHEIPLEVSFGEFRREGGHVFTGIIRDITERKGRQGRDQFLIRLDDAVRTLSDPEEIGTTSARLLGEHLGADRCASAQVEADEDHFPLTGDYTRGVPSIVGRFAMSQFGDEALRLSRAGEPYVVEDVEEDPRVTAEDLAAYRQTIIRAVISMPLLKGGRFRADGEYRWFLARALPVRDPAGQVGAWFGTSVDIEDRKRSEAEREEILGRERSARDEAEQANRLKDEFLAPVSHELRTPLTAILGWAHLLRRGGLEGEGAAGVLETIERNARSQTQLIHDLLDVSRIVTGKLRLDVMPVDPHSFIDPAVEAVRPAAEAKGVRLQKLIDTGAGAVFYERGCQEKTSP